MPCQIAVEELMACGIGVCMTCVLPVIGDDGQTRMVRSCVDGPVFHGDRVRFDDIGTIPSDTVGARMVSAKASARTTARTTAKPVQPAAAKGRARAATSTTRVRAGESAHTDEVQLDSQHPHTADTESATTTSSPSHAAEAHR